MDNETVQVEVAADGPSTEPLANDDQISQIRAHHQQALADLEDPGYVRAAQVAAQALQQQAQQADQYARQAYFTAATRGMHADDIKELTSSVNSGYLRDWDEIHEEIERLKEYRKPKPRTQPSGNPVQQRLHDQKWTPSAGEYVKMLAQERANLTPQQRDAMAAKLAKTSSPQTAQHYAAPTRTENSDRVNKRVRRLRDR